MNEIQKMRSNVCHCHDYDVPWLRGSIPQVRLTLYEPYENLTLPDGKVRFMIPKKLGDVSYIIDSKIAQHALDIIVDIILTHHIPFAHGICTGGITIIIITT